MSANFTSAFALGVVWAGPSDVAPPPQPLGAATIFTPVGDVVWQALRAVRKSAANRLIG
jgi:propanol-preferring alcohol dehydrogenase